jgi:5-methylthioribose kinase
MAYKALDIDTVCDYLSGIEEVQRYFGGEAIEASEIGDGNLNFVYLVQSVSDPSKAVIAKQAVPYLRIAGEGFPLSRERMTYEIRALRTFKELSSDYVPEIYYTSEAMSLLVMEYLGDHVIFRTGLLEGKQYAHFAEHISSYMAETLFHTSSLSLQSEEKRALMDRFNSNTELCKLTEDFVFTFPYMEHETNDNENTVDNPLAEMIFADMAFKERVLELKYKFMTQADALLHGDLHTGSLMVNAEETYMIDPEFAFVGPFGFDIGALLSNLIQNYIHHTIVTEDEKHKAWLLETIRDTLMLFEQKFLALWDATETSALIIPELLNEESKKSYQRKFMQGILHDTIGFAGCKMARRIFGIAGVADIRGIEDPALRAQAEQRVFEIARGFVMEYDQIDSVDEILKRIKG